MIYRSPLLTGPLTNEIRPSVEYDAGLMIEDRKGHDSSTANPTIIAPPITSIRPSGVRRVLAVIGAEAELFRPEASCAGVVPLPPVCVAGGVVDAFEGWLRPLRVLLDIENVISAACACV